MASHTSIEWAHHTFNPWHGCAKLSAGCRNCYAEALDGRHLLEPTSHWGLYAPRRFASESYWRKPLAWNRAAERAGKRARVFCMSMGDLFEVHWLLPQAKKQAISRARLFALIERTLWLDWLLLTKRPERFASMLPASWLVRPAPNVWLGASVESLFYAADRLPVLLNVPARVHFVSYEPALGPIDLEAAAPGRCLPLELDWVIAGAESGARARPAQLDWIRAARDQCQRLGIRFFFKQWVERGRKVSLPVLDGCRWVEVPADVVVPARQPLIARTVARR